MKEFSHMEGALVIRPIRLIITMVMLQIDKIGDKLIHMRNSHYIIFKLNFIKHSIVYI